MTEWMVTIDTPHGFARDEDALLAFTAALDAIREVTGTGTSLNIETGVLSATLTVSADDVRHGVDLAVSLFDAALERIGFMPGTAAHVEAESIEEPEPVSV